MVTEVKPLGYSDATLVKLSREIAQDIYPLDKILEHNAVTPEQFRAIARLPRFQSLLEAMVSEWNSSMNTAERVKTKAAALLEDWLPELHGRLHDEKESLAAKIEGAKLAARLAGLGLDKANISGDIGERLSVTINLGADSQLRFDKSVTPRVIEGHAEAAE